MRRRFSVALLAALPGLSAPLFDGKTLNGWRQEGDRPSFQVAEGELRTLGGSYPPNWIHTERRFADFRLRFEYKLTEWAEAAVIVRAPRLGRPARSGIAITLSHDFHGKLSPYVTGAITGVRPPRRLLPPGFGVWRKAELRIRGGKLEFQIDGELLQSVTLADDPELRYRPAEGHIGFPDFGGGYSVRNIEMEDFDGRPEIARPLDAPESDWFHFAGGNFEVRDGILRGWDGHGVYYAPGEWTDFEVSMLVRTHQWVNSGVFLRGDPANGKRGYEIQIYNLPETPYPTGSVYNHARSKIEEGLEGRWFYLQLRVSGTRTVVRIDGKTVAESETLPSTALAKGRIGWQIHTDRASIEIQDIAIRNLAAR